MKKIILVLLILLTLTGCKDYRELTDMAIVSMIGIDKKDEYNVIVQVFNYSGMSEEEKESIVVYEGSGKTIHNAFRNMTLSCPKKLYLGHTKIVVVSEELAKNDITSIFDLILRDAEMEKDFSLLITKSDIKDTIKTINPKNEIPAENLYSSIDVSSKVQGSIHKVSFDMFASNTLKNGIDPVLPVLEIKNKKLSLIPNIAIFNKNKLEGYLSTDASIGYNIINNSIDSNVISFKCNDNDYASIEILKNKASMKYDINKNLLTIDVNMNGSLSELNCDIDITQDKNMKYLREKLSDRFNEIIIETVNEEKKYNSDFLGIGEYVYRNNYKMYNEEKINELKKDLNTKINIKTMFTGNGSIKKGDEKY